MTRLCHSIKLRLKVLSMPDEDVLSEAAHLASSRPQHPDAVPLVGVRFAGLRVPQRPVGAVQLAPTRCDGKCDILLSWKLII